MRRYYSCSCGKHRSAAEHHEAISAQGVVEEAVLRAILPSPELRRRFLSAVGAGTALAAISSLFPLGAAKEAFAQGTGKLEKTKLKVGFIPITCATPIIMAHPMGFYSKHGLDVEVVKTAGWAVIRDKTLNKEYDAAHMLSPMPLAITLGAGATAVPYTMPAVENINGQAITLAIRHKERRDPKLWKGFKFAVPFDYSMHNCGARPRSRHRHPDPLGAAARDGGQPARRQHRRLSRA
jgi:nitrate/nitrite transport system substrate-binding protein